MHIYIELTTTRYHSNVTRFEIWTILSIMQKSQWLHWRTHCKADSNNLLILVCIILKNQYFCLWDVWYVHKCLLSFELFYSIQPIKYSFRCTDHLGCEINIFFVRMRRLFLIPCTINNMRLFYSNDSSNEIKFKVRKRLFTDEIVFYVQKFWWQKIEISIGS